MIGLVDVLLQANIAPFVTLYHWDLPQALQDKGGWGSRATIDAYLRYVDAVIARLGDRVVHWMTHNEPWCISIFKPRNRSARGCRAKRAQAGLAGGA